MDRGLARQNGHTPRVVHVVYGPASTDADLLDLCRRGDAEAWETLVGKYERLVFTVALRNGLGREDAADVTQTVFVALLDSLGAISEGERLGSWLMTVARRHAWRQRARRDREGPLPAEAFDRADTVDVYANWDRTVAVQDALHRLGRPCRELLTCLYFDPEEPSYAEIAHRLSRSIGTIGPMRARCLRHLRGLLGED